MLQDIITRAKEISSMNKSGLNGKGRKLEKWIGCQPPVWPWCKLNSDMVLVKEINEGSTAGGLLRDSNRNWVDGFPMNIGYCSVTVAELHGVYQGLVMAWDHSVCWLLIEVDSRCVVQILKNLRVMTNEYSL